MSSKAIQAHIPEEVYQQAAAVIQAAGLSVSRVLHEVMAYIAREKQVPWEMFQWNAETLEAVRDAAEGRVERTSIEDIVALIENERAGNSGNYAA